MKNAILAELYALMKNPPPADVWRRFCSYINPQSWTACWEWQGSRGTKGYGQFKWHGYAEGTHRLLWIWLVRAASKAQATDHVVCDNRICCNPLHSVPTTTQKNVLRGLSPMAANAQKTHCPLGHPLSVETSPPSYRARGYRKCRECDALRARAKRAARI